MASEASSRANEDFSLVLGGPLYQLLIRVGLIRPSLDRISWRLLIIVGFA